MLQTSDEKLKRKELLEMRMNVNTIEWVLSKTKNDPLEACEVRRELKRAISFNRAHSSAGPVSDAQPKHTSQH